MSSLESFLLMLDDGNIKYTKDIDDFTTDIFFDSDSAVCIFIFSSDPVGRLLGVEISSKVWSE